ncbi:alpha/beta hydrolase [Methylocystis sp.]|uniref:alpha/beta hydrolase n=1 Tax=Methylocystis sp. TaxID=1911079 RepID=UPI003D127209
MSALDNAIILHGACERAEYFSSEHPAQSNSHWLPWMQKQLLIRGVATQTPEMPSPYDPDYGSWKRELERFDIGPRTLLIGYSCGAGFLLRWLSERVVPIARLILVAPWLDPERARTDAFFDFKIDSALASRAKSIDLLVSNDDHASIQKSVEQIIAALPPIRVHRFRELGHFTSEDLGSTAFPQLRAIAFE